MASREEVVYDSNTPLESVFHNATSRVLDFLILNQKFDYHLSGINKATSIPTRSLQRVLPNLVEKGLVMETGRVGNTRMYMLNPDSELAAILRQFVLTGIDHNLQNASAQIETDRRLINENESITGPQ